MPYLEIAALGRRPRPSKPEGTDIKPVDRHGRKIESAGPGKMAAWFLCAIRDRSTALWRSLVCCFQPDIAKSPAESIAAKCFAIVALAIRSDAAPEERKSFKDRYCAEFAAKYNEFRSSGINGCLPPEAAIAGAHGLARATIQREFSDDFQERLNDIDEKLWKRFAIEESDKASAKDWVSLNFGGLRHPTFDNRNLTFDLRHSMFDVRHAAFDNSTPTIRRELENIP